MRPLYVAAVVHVLPAILQFGGAWLTGSAGILANAVHISIGTAAHPVEGKLVFRLSSEVADNDLKALEHEFRDILLGPIELAAASPSEWQDDDVPELPRLRLLFDRMHYGRLRQFIDRLNRTGPIGGGSEHTVSQEFPE